MKFFDRPKSRRSSGLGASGKPRARGPVRTLVRSGVVAGIVLLAMTAAACGPATGPQHYASSPSVPMATRLAVVNALYANTQPRFIAQLAGNSRTVAEITAKEAAARAIVSCNEGSGTKVIATAMVDTSQGPNPQWAVFMNPPGTHFSISTGLVPPKHPPILNWYAGFVPTHGSSPIFCTFGRSSQLPTLPAFGSKQ